MPIINKPDFKIFAQDAKTGEIQAFPDILRGWGVTIDQTAGKPPMEWFNALQKRTDEWLTYLAQRGLSEWQSTLDYPKNAVVQFDGKFYVAKNDNKSAQPDLSQNDWILFSEALGAASALQKSQNLADVQNKAESRKNLELGTAATKDVGASLGNVVSVGDYGLGRTIGTVTQGIDFKSYAFTQGSHLFVNMSSCANIPPGLNATAYYFVFVHGLRDEDSAPGLTVINYLDPNEVWTAYGAGKAGSRNWKLTRTYNTGFKPSPADINAYSKPESDGRYAYKSITVNGRPLSSNVNLTANDVNAWNKTEADGRFIFKSGDTIRALNVENGLYVGENVSTDGSLGVAKEARIGGNVNIGSALIQTDGNIKGSVWGGGYLNEWINSTFGIKNTANFSGNGWWQCGSTGMIIQWGTVGQGNDLQVTFPITFPKFCLSVQMTQSASQFGSQSSSNISATNKSRTGFTSHVYIQEVSADWFAVGF